MSKESAEPKVIENVIRIPPRKISIPAWAIKAGFIHEEERNRFIESVRAGYTPLHVAQCEEKERRGEYEIVDGVHRFEALVSLGVSEIPCYSHGVLSLSERKAIALRLAWSFQRNGLAFGDALREVRDFDPTLLDWAPMDATEIERMISELNTDISLFEDEEEVPTVSPVPKKGKATSTRSVKSFQCPHCGKSFNV